MVVVLLAQGVVALLVVALVVRFWREWLLS